MKPMAGSLTMLLKQVKICIILKTEGCRSLKVQKFSHADIFCNFWYQTTKFRIFSNKPLSRNYAILLKSRLLAGYWQRNRVEQPWFFSQRKRPFSSLSPSWWISCKFGSEMLDDMFSIHCPFSSNGRNYWQNLTLPGLIHFQIRLLQGG